MFDRRLRWLMIGMGGGIVLMMLAGVGIGIAPFLFGEGKSCGDLRGHPHYSRYSSGSSLCRQGGGKATLSVCGVDGRWTHKDVDRC